MCGQTAQLSIQSAGVTGKNRSVFHGPLLSSNCKWMLPSNPEKAASKWLAMGRSTLTHAPGFVPCVKLILAGAGNPGFPSVQCPLLTFHATYTALSDGRTKNI